MIIINGKELRIEHTSPSRIFSFCPFHKDRNRPNFEISLVEPFRGKYYCWSCGASGEIDGSLLPEARSREKESPDFDELHLKYTEYPYVETMRNKLACLWEVGDQRLNEYEIGWDGKAWTAPMRLDGKIVGIQRRLISGDKWCISGSKLGFFLPREWDVDQSRLVVCEGLSDAVSVSNLNISGGCVVIGRPNCRSLVRQTADFIYQCRQFERVLIVADTGPEELEGASRLQVHLAKTVPTKIYLPSSKDIRLEIKMEGKLDVRQSLGNALCF